jgi:excinuclease UvrABC nuclease subunit
MALHTDPELLLGPLAARMLRLASQARYEEAAELRDRGALLERTVHRHLEAQALRDASEVVISSGGRAFLLRAGRLAQAVDRAGATDEEVVATLLHEATDETEHSDDDGFRREAAIINAWLRRTADVRVLYARGPWSQPAAARPRALFRPVQAEAATSIKRSRARTAAPELMASAAT